MGQFKYKTVTKDNLVREGSIKAFSQASAKKKLSSNGSTVLFVAPDKSQSFNERFSVSLRKFSQFERIFFFSNLALMTSSGLSVISSLYTLRDQIRSRPAKKAIAVMALDVENGQSLSAAMSKHPRLFSDFIVDTVALGEMTGTMSNTLDRIALDLQKDNELKKKVIEAISYPVIVFVIMIAVTGVLAIYVMPKIEQLFAELEAPLPIITKTILASSGFLASQPFLILGAIIFVILLISFLKRIKKTRFIIHYIILKLPVFGNLIREFNLSRFFRALESLVANGISLVRSVEVAKKTLNNDVYRKALDKAQPMLMHGVTLTEALKPHPHLFPPQARKIVEVGEQTGRIGDTLKRISLFYENSVNHTTKMMTSMIEPFLMVAIGIVVGLLALSIFVPIYQVATVF
ncbi:type II secretion system F family protein [Patescibacteria group bacterium]